MVAGIYPVGTWPKSLCHHQISHVELAVSGMMIMVSLLLKLLVPDLGSGRKRSKRVRSSLLRKRELGDTPVVECAELRYVIIQPV